MSLASPYFLLLLIPWAVVSIWLLLGQRPMADVPFVSLWRGPVHPPRQKRSLYPPPVPIVLGILAMLLTVVGSARPEILRSNGKAATTQSTGQPEGRLTFVSARKLPAPQVMVKTSGKGTVLIDAGASVVRWPVDAANGEATQFIPVPKLENGTTIGLADSPVRWRVEMRQSWPIIEPRSAMAPELSRMFDTYRRRRPPGEQSRPLTIVSSVEQAGEAPAIILPSGGSRSSTEPARWSDHPIFQSVKLTAANESSTASAPSGFTPIAWLGDRPAVAVRDAPSRQVWVGLQGESWSGSPDFVIFWTNVLDWAGHGGEEIKVIPPDPSASTPKPQTEAPPRLALAPFLLWCALTCLALSAGLWGRNEKRAKVEG